MLDHTLFVLEKVSFNRELFSKELKKALAELQPVEISFLKDWLTVFARNKENLSGIEIHFMKT